MRYTLAHPQAGQPRQSLLLTWTLRILNILVIGVAAWAMIETAAFLKAYVAALAG